MLINQCTKNSHLKKKIKSFEKGILCAANLKNANKQYKRMQKTMPSDYYTKNKQKPQTNKKRTWKQEMRPSKKLRPMLQFLKWIKHRLI